MPNPLFALAACAALFVAVRLLLVVRRRLAATDARAAAEGWTITKLPWGARVYRDPRLDQLAVHHTARVLAEPGAGRGAG